MFEQRETVHHHAARPIRVSGSGVAACLPWRMLHGDNRQRSSSRRAVTDANLGRDAESRWLLCAMCRNPVTRLSLSIEVGGAHRHTFANPHGLVFRIRCFSAAVGCLSVGVESTEFAWFAGYAWNIEICGRCAWHLGWSFRSEAHRFYGLVDDHLAEDGHETRS